MKKVTLLFTFTMIFSLLLAGCALQPAPTQGIPPEIRTPTPNPTGAGDSKTITLEDSGKTIQLAVGERFLLKLGNEYTWDISISDQTVVERVKNVMVILGAQGLYDALKPGTVTLSATGDPVCNQAVPSCKAPSIQFSIAIEVTP
ncbi:hypothetical protein LARV_00496 [Longilinea arvoryzae]|uniref:Uncharacterized protein n=1 Tax=Longilinea arvoryzae TaxID=360412 RepID=A0A0S7BFC6_9CHLR|nr:hypothetical protein [Longilinea arvoryzae]GAP12760.1 hypothetical protein LARV_00496 [Longilinea arvoryzae]